MSFIAVLKNAKKNFEAYQAKLRAEEKERQAKSRVEAAERERASNEAKKLYEEKREATKIFEYWHYRGKAIGIKKQKYQSGNYIYVQTKFHLDISPSKQEDFSFPRTDVPVGNGHDMVIIYAKIAGTKSGQAVRAINVSAKSYVDIDHNLESLAKSTGHEYTYSLARVNRDLVKYVNSI